LVVTDASAEEIDESIVENGSGHGGLLLIELRELGQLVLIDIILFTGINVIISIANSTHDEDLVYRRLIGNSSPDSFLLHLCNFLILVGCQVEFIDLLLSNYEQSLVFGGHHLIDVTNERLIHLEGNLTLGKQVEVAHRAKAHVADCVAKAVVDDDIKQ